jgi:hypothetical protein
MTSYPISCIILCIHVFYHIKLNTFAKVSFAKFIIFKAKSTFEPKCEKLFLFFLSSMLRAFLIFRRNVAHLLRKKDVLEKKKLSTSEV